MRIPEGLRWILIPVATAGGFTAALAFVSIGGDALRLFVSETQIETLLRLDVRVGLLGTAAAFGTVVAGSSMAPSAQRTISLVLLVLGGSVAWLLLRHWSFPEAHALAYQQSSVPLTLTCCGGVVAAALIWWRYRRRRLPALLLA